MSQNTDSRYPYTHAADYLRCFGGYDKGGVRLSRSDASQIRAAVAAALGMDDAELAAKLADHYLKTRAEIDGQSMRRLTQAMGAPM